MHPPSGHPESSPAPALQLRQDLAGGLRGRSIASETERYAIGEHYRRLLVEDVLPFWFPRSVDTVHGGFFSCLDRDGSCMDTDKSVWAQGRMTWMLLRCYQDLVPQENWLAWADSGIRFIQQHCFDTDGRMFFHLNREGAAIRKRRYAFSEAFAAIAFAAHAKVTGNRASADLAIRLYQHFLNWNFHPPEEAVPKHTSTRPLIGLAPHMIALVTAQELRHQLGTNAIDASDTETRVETILRLFVKPEHQCVMEMVEPDGSISNHLDGRTLNPGHAMEAAWFILQEASYQGRREWIEPACNMLNWMWKRSWDQEHGGILYFTDLEDRPVQEYWHDMKFWWPHNEALIASIMAYQLTGNTDFARMHQAVHDWSFAHFLDVEQGEWYGYLNRSGAVSNRAKGNLWKSCFHYPRSLLWSWQWLTKRPLLS